MKSDRIKKLEKELENLEQWLKLGLVPKGDIEKHQAEIDIFKQKIEEEHQRLKRMKETGEVEEYIAPKRGQSGKPVYQEPQTIPGMDSENMTDAGLNMETESFETEATTISAEDSDDRTSIDEDDGEDPFSDKSRWKRGILEDPDSDSW